MVLYKRQGKNVHSIKTLYNIPMVQIIRNLRKLLEPRTYEYNDNDKALLLMKENKGDN